MTHRRNCVPRRERQPEARSHSVQRYHWSMPRFLIGLIVASVVFTVYAVIDCAMTDTHRVRALPKAIWILIILFFPIIGAVLWFLIGRGRASQEQRLRSIAPDDDPAFLHKLRDEREREERIRRLEKKLADLDDREKRDDGTGGSGRRDA